MAKRRREDTLTLEERLQAALVPDWEQPYKVPENWCWVKIELIASIFTGNSINERVKEEKYTGRTDGLVYLATKDINFDSTINYDTNVNVPQNEGFKVAPKFSTLLCIEGGSAGRKIGFTIQDVCFVNKLCAFVPKDAVNAKYLYYTIQSNTFLNQFNDKKHGLIGGVSVKEISSIYVSLAPLNQQELIVDRIESLFGKLDEAKQKTKDTLDRFETRKAAILHRAFTGELTAQWRKKNGMGMESWRRICFDESFEKMQNGLAKRSGDTGSFCVVIRLANLSETGFLTEDLRTILLDEKEKINYCLKKNDVLMIRVNGSKENVGKQFLVEEDNQWAFCDHIIRIRYKETFSPAYMVYFSKSIGYRLYVKDNLVSTAGQNTISRKGMATLLVPVPELREQIEIVNILDNFFAKEQHAKEAAEAVLKQIELIKKSILARAFRGELGTNDPAEESAVELVRQILEKGDETVDKPKARMRRIVIPAEIKSELSNANEEEIIKILMKSAPEAVSIQTIMSISRKKFELMDALRNLEKKQLVFRTDTGKYLLMR